MSPRSKSNKIGEPSLPDSCSNMPLIAQRGIQAAQIIYSVDVKRGEIGEGAALMRVRERGGSSTYSLDPFPKGATPAK